MTGFDPTNPSIHETRLFETLDELDEYHDEVGLGELDLGVLTEYAQARAQLMLVAEVHKLRQELTYIRQTVTELAG